MYRLIAGILLFIATGAWADNLKPFDPTPYNQSDLPALASPISFEGSKYSGPYASSLSLDDVKTHVAISFQGTRSVEFTGTHLVVKTTINTYSSGPKSTVTGHPLFIYTIAMDAPGRIVERRFDLGPELATARNDPNSKLIIDTLENMSIGDSQIRNTAINDFGILWQPVTPEGGLGEFVPGGVSKFAAVGESPIPADVCGISLNQAHFQVNGPYQGYLVGHIHLVSPASSSCSLRVDALKVVDTKTGRLQYYQATFHGSDGAGASVSTATITEQFDAP